MADIDGDRVILGTDINADPSTLTADPYTCDHDWSYHSCSERDDDPYLRCDRCGYYESVEEDDPRWEHRLH